MKKLAALVAAASIGALPLTAMADSLGLGGGADVDVGIGATVDDNSVHADTGARATAGATAEAAGPQNGNRESAPGLVGGTADRVVGTVFGQDDGRPVRATGTVAATQNANAAAAGGTSVGDVVSSIERSSATAGTVTELDAVSDVAVVDVAKVMADNHIAIVSEKAANNEDGITQLREAITVNSAVKAAVDANGVVAGDVVAADVNADGSLTLYVYSG